MTPLALALALTVPAADPPPPAWQGVWAGTIGTLPVRACLARRGDAYAVGSYYYLSKLRPIRLEQQGGSKLWLEGWSSSTGPAQPRWTFDAVGAQLLTGTWADGPRALPFRLTRVTGANTDEPCGSAAFMAPRLRPIRATTARASRDGIAYSRITYHPGPAFEEVSLQSFAMPGSNPATQRINAALRRHIAVEGAAADWRACVAGQLNSMGEDGVYAASITPRMITARWLAAAMDEGGDCGGPHPNSSTTSLLFDRTTGAETALEDWLNATGIQRHRDGDRGYHTIRPALRSVVLRHAGAIEADCRGPVEEEEFWDIGLARTGLSFTPMLAHVVQACAESTVVPWTALTPFLNDAGRAGRATLSGR